jgi:hypothetical protein
MDRERVVKILLDAFTIPILQAEIIADKIIAEEAPKEISDDPARCRYCGQYLEEPEEQPKLPDNFPDGYYGSVQECVLVINSIFNYLKVKE